MEEMDIWIVRALFKDRDISGKDVRINWAENMHQDIK